MDSHAVQYQITIYLTILISQPVVWTYQCRFHCMLFFGQGRRGNGEVSKIFFKLPYFSLYRAHFLTPQRRLKCWCTLYRRCRLTQMPADSASRGCCAASCSLPRLGWAGGSGAMAAQGWERLHQP